METNDRIAAMRDARLFGATQALSRLMLASMFGQKAYAGDRDYELILGYPKQPSFQTYRNLYEKWSLAGRIVDLPAKDTWKYPPAVTEHGRADTDFTKTFAELNERVHVWSSLMRLDQLAGIGQYGVMLIGVRDGGALEELVAPGSLSDQGPAGILYLRPLNEGSVTVYQKNSDTANERFGLPELYKLNLESGKEEVIVHWHRVLHVAENCTTSPWQGQSRLARCMQPLHNIIKLVGGGAEAAWLAMRPGTLLTTQPDYEIDDDDIKDTIQQEIKEYAHDMLRFLTIEGMNAQQLGTPDVPNIESQFDANIALIAAESGIPQRVLLGSAAGELAAAKYDLKQWAGVISARQQNYAGPEIVRPFVERLQAWGILPPTPDGFTLGIAEPGSDDYRWPTILQTDALEESEILRNKAAAVQSLTDKVQMIMPSTMTERRQWLGLPAEPPNEQIAVERAGEPSAVVVNALSNLAEGKITIEQFSQFVVSLLMEHVQE